jgi:hypothetical protein
MTARAATLWHRLGDGRQGLSALGRLVNPCRWVRIPRLFGELLSGGLVVPPPDSAQHWSPEREQQVPIWSVIQPDGDFQLKVRGALLDTPGWEELLDDHLRDVAAASARIADAGRQLLAARFTFVLPSSAVLAHEVVKTAGAIIDGARVEQILGGVAWWAVALSGVGLVIGVGLRPVLAWLVRRKLTAIVKDQSRFGNDPRRPEMAGTLQTTV